MASNAVQQPYQTAADASAGYAKGYSDMLRYLAAQEAQNTSAFLQQIGAPQSAISQYNQASQFPADVLYGATGEIPGTSLSQQGAAFGQAAGNLGGIFGQQLAYNANIQAQEMAHRNALAQMDLQRAAQSSSEGTESGLTPYQEASLAMRAMEFQTEQDRYAQQDELDWLKFQADLEQEEAERTERENAAAADALLYQGVFMLMNGEDPFKNKKYMRALNQALGMGPSSTALTALTGTAGDIQDAEAAARAEALERRAGKRDDIRGLIASEFNSFEGNNKKAAVTAIMGAIETQFPNFAGWKRDRVRNMVRQHVNSQWATRDRPGRSGGAGGAGETVSPSRISTAFNDFVQGLTTPTSDTEFLRRYRSVAGYRTAMSKRAVTAIMGSIRDSMPRAQFRKQRPKILKLVRNYVRRNRGHFKVKRRPRPTTPTPANSGLPSPP